MVCQARCADDAAALCTCMAMDLLAYACAFWHQMAELTSWHNDARYAEACSHHSEMLCAQKDPKLICGLSLQALACRCCSLGTGSALCRQAFTPAFRDPQCSTMRAVARQLTRPPLLCIADDARVYFAQRCVIPMDMAWLAPFPVDWVWQLDSDTPWLTRTLQCSDCVHACSSWPLCWSGRTAGTSCPVLATRTRSSG